MGDSLRDEIALDNAYERLQEIKSNARKHSKSYYQRNYTYWDGMTEVERAKVEKNIMERKLRTKARYNNNKDYYKQKQKEYRARKKDSESSEDDLPIIKKKLPKIIKKKNPVAVVHFN
mgnify:CR=1 FL=1